METIKLPSQFQINDSVLFNATETISIPATIVGVCFTQSSVFYDIRVEYDSQVPYVINSMQAAFLVKNN